MTPERPPRLRAVSRSDLAEARSLLRQGLSLREAANELDVYSAELDRCLWTAAGYPDGWNPWRRGPEAMFD